MAPNSHRPERGEPECAAPTEGNSSPRLERVTAEYRDYKAAKDQQQWCRQRVRYPHPEPFERCQVSLIGNGSVLLLQIATSCGADSCSVESWVVSSALDSVTHLAQVDLGGNVEASADGRCLFTDLATDLALPGADPTSTDPFGGNRELVSERLDLRTGKKALFTPCFSLRLAPDGSWLACRDRNGNVLGVPASGGPAATLACSDTIPVFQPYSYPDPVEFVTPSAVRFEVESAETGQRQVHQHSMAAGQLPNVGIECATPGQ